MKHMLPAAKQNERGSALLIVFLFAAVLAISLYMEMPTVAFEARRAKEQLLIDRGNEYAHAVKLFYRKFRTYPPSIDALENTNRIRFLRHKFKDPMTGDDKWRLLHAGPGGQLTDSKVNPIGLSANGQTSGANGSGTNSGFSGFANSFSGSSTSGDGTAGATVAALPQRPPEMPINGGGAAASSANADPTQSLLPSSSAQRVPVQPGSTAAPTAAADASATQPAGQMQPANGATPSNPMQGVQSLMTNPNPLPGGGTPATAAPLVNPLAPTNASTGTSGSSGPALGAATTSQSRMGVIQTGGLAGVASLAKGPSIKTVNDQTDYSLWEFYYDPTKDTSLTGNSGMNAAGGLAPQSGASPATLAPANSANPPAPTPSATTPPGTTPPQQP